jgi:hypothetical protein
MVSGPGSEIRIRGNSTSGSTLNGSATSGRGDASGTPATPGRLDVLDGGRFIIEDTSANPLDKAIAAADWDRLRAASGDLADLLFCVEEG